MSARMEVETWGWEALGPTGGENAGKKASEIEVECLFRNSDQKNLVAPLREIHAGLPQAELLREGAEERCRAALAQQEQWDAWLVQRELLRNEIKRGKECLEYLQTELTTLRAQMEDWAAHERICGQNPIFDYMQAIAIREGLERFLPAWLKRREEQLQSLSRKMEQCAKQNGLEHLL